MEHQRTEYRKLQAELDKALKTMHEEKERHKAMVLYLMQDRQKLLIKLHEEKQRNASPTSKRNEYNCKCSMSTISLDATPGANNDNMPSDLQSALNALRRELVESKALLEQERANNAHLKHVVHQQEEDLTTLRQSLLTKTRQMNIDDTTIDHSNASRQVQHRTAPPAYNMR